MASRTGVARRHDRIVAKMRKTCDLLLRLRPSRENCQVEIFTVGLSHGDDWPPLRGDDGHLSFTWYCWQGGWQIIQHPVGLPTALEAGEESHRRDLSSVFMTVGDADTFWHPQFFSTVTF